MHADDERHSQRQRDVRLRLSLTTAASEISDEGRPQGRPSSVYDHFRRRSRGEHHPVSSCRHRHRRARVGDRRGVVPCDGLGPQRVRGSRRLVHLGSLHRGTRRGADRLRTQRPQLPAPRPGRAAVLRCSATSAAARRTRRTCGSRRVRSPPETSTRRSSTRSARTSRSSRSASAATTSGSAARRVSACSRRSHSADSRATSPTRRAESTSSRSEIAEAAPKIAAVLDGIHERAPQAKVARRRLSGAAARDQLGLLPVRPGAAGRHRVAPCEEQGAERDARVRSGEGRQHVRRLVRPQHRTRHVQAAGIAWTNAAVVVPPSYPAHPNMLGTQGAANAVLRALGYRVDLLSGTLNQPVLGQTLPRLGG